MHIRFFRAAGCTDVSSLLLWHHPWDPLQTSKFKKCFTVRHAQFYSEMANTMHDSEICRLNP